MGFHLEVDPTTPATAYTVGYTDLDIRVRRRMPDHSAPGQENWEATVFHTEAPVAAAPLSRRVLGTHRVGHSWHSVFEYMDSHVDPQGPGRMERQMWPG
jgi:hypothetical protein